MVAAELLHLTMHPAISVAMFLSNAQVCSKSESEHSAAMLWHVSASTDASLCVRVCSMPNNFL